MKTKSIFFDNCLVCLFSYTFNVWMSNFSHLANGLRFCCRILRLFIISSTLCNAPAPLVDQQPQSVMLPPPCFTVACIIYLSYQTIKLSSRRLFLSMWSDKSFSQTWRCRFEAEAFFLACGHESHDLDSRLILDFDDFRLDLSLISWLRTYSNLSLEWKDLILSKQWLDPNSDRY